MKYGTNVKNSEGFTKVKNVSLVTAVLLAIFVALKSGTVSTCVYRRTPTRKGEYGSVFYIRKDAKNVLHLELGKLVLDKSMKV